MQTIEIRTTQNVMIEYELAALRDRIFAFLLDWLIVVILYAGLLVIVEWVVEESFFDTLSEVLILFLLPVWSFIFYQLASEILANGQSWGKKAMDLRVVRLDGKEPGFSDYLLRAIFHIVDTGFSFGTLAALLISSSTHHQRLGDMTANTTVIRLRHQVRFQLQDILKINSLKDYEPQYPEVRQLTEQDMLLIKNTISRHLQHRNEAHLEAVQDLVTHLEGILEIKKNEESKVEFLKTLIRDYIVLTR